MYCIRNWGVGVGRVFLKVRQFLRITKGENSLFPVKISRKVEEILFQQDKTEKLLQMAF